MRHSVQSAEITPPFPLLESSDLPGGDDWSFIESLHCDESLEGDDDRFATLSLSSRFDD